MTIEPMTFTIEATSKKGPLSLTYTVYNQFAFTGQWYKGNLHSHLGRFDEIRPVIDWYRSRNYNFLALTDHDIIRPVEKETEPGMTLIQGAELSECHVVGLGIEEMVPKAPRSSEGLVAILENIRSQGGIAILAHPHWSGWTWDELRTTAEAGLD